MHDFTYKEDRIMEVDDLLDDSDDLASLLGPLQTLHLKLSAFGLMQDVGAKQCGQVVRVHLISRQLQFTEKLYMNV